MLPFPSRSRACRTPRTAVAQAAELVLCSAAAQAQTTTVPSPTAEATLAPVTVSSGAEQENPTAPVTGFVAQRALSATKTDTPLIETPQAISVVTRDQMEAQSVQTLRQVTAYTAGAVSNYFDSRVDTSAMTTPAATLADAMVAYDAGDWRVAFNVVNLTDKVHITQCLARGDCFYGQARTYTLTSTYRF